MSRMTDIENDIMEIQERMAARSALIGREVETAAPILDSFGQSRQIAGAKHQQNAAATREHPIASAISAASTLYMAAQRTGLLDRLGTRQVASKVKRAGNRTYREASLRGQKSVADMKSSSSDLVSDLSETADRKLTDAKIQSQKAYRSGSNFVQQNPLALGLLAAGIGAAAASFFMMERISGSDDRDELGESPKPLDTPKAEAAMSAVAATPPATRPARRKSAAKGTVAKKSGTPKAVSKKIATRAAENSGQTNGVANPS